MKHLILFILIAISTVSYGQAPKKAKAIILVSDSLTEDDIANALIQNGYSIESVNKYSIKTGEKKIKSWNYDIEATKVNQGYRLSIFLSSNVSVNIGYGVTSGPSRTVCLNRGMENSGFKLGWRDLEKVANSVNADLDYEI